MTRPFRARRVSRAPEHRRTTFEASRLGRRTAVRAVAIAVVGGIAIVAAAGAASVVDTKLESGDPDLGLGLSIANAGDVNGDGYGDVIAGGHLVGGGTFFARAAFVFHGGPSGLASTASALPVTRIESDSVLAGFGDSVAGAGDVNGDGYADVIVGSPDDDGGAAYIYLGGPNGIPDGDRTTAATVLTSTQSSSGFGASVASAGDVNGDGYADVIVGAPLWGAPGLSEGGAAFVFHGGPSGIPNASTSLADAIIGSDQANSELGTSVSSAGDVNGDGHADVIVGAPLYENGPFYVSGGAFVFLGGPGGIASGDASMADSVLLGDEIWASLGETVSEAGDVDGDGYSDVVVAAYRWAYVFRGSESGVPDGTQSTADTQLEIDDGTQYASNFVWSVDRAGDVDGDGFGDLLVGASYYSAGETQEGVTWLFLGSDTGIAGGHPAVAADVQLELDQAGAWFGMSVAGGDLDGDGFGDALVGAADYDNGDDEEGAGFLFLGGAADPGPVPLRQHRIGAGAIEPGGAVFGTDSFGVELHADPHPGMARATLQVELCAAGLAFGAAACTSSVSPSWLALGPDGVALAHTVSGLAGDGSYSWRARALYTPTASGPGTVTPGPWRRLQGRASPGEIRLLPEPGFSVGLASALAFVAGRGRRRSRER